MFLHTYVLATVFSRGDKKMETVRATVEKIRSLEVKGARNVAIASLEALQALAKETKAKNREAFLGELSEAKDLLFASRPTEPLMRNAVRFVLTAKWRAAIRRKLVTYPRLCCQVRKSFCGA